MLLIFLSEIPYNVGTKIVNSLAIYSYSQHIYYICTMSDVIKRKDGSAVLFLFFIVVRISIFSLRRFSIFAFIFFAVIDLFIKEDAPVLGNSCPVAVTVYLDDLSLQHNSDTIEHYQECNRIHKYAEVYSYTYQVSEHSAEYQSDTHYNEYLILRLVRIKVDKHKAYRRRQYRMSHSELKRIRLVETHYLIRMQFTVHHEHFHYDIQRKSYFQPYPHTHRSPHEVFRNCKADESGYEREVSDFFKEFYESAVRIINIVKPEPKQGKQYETQVPYKSELQSEIQLLMHISHPDGEP